MQVYMAAIEGQKTNLLETSDNFIEYVLTSYFYLGERKEVLDLLLQKCKHILIDSGAYSFQRGKNVSIENFVNKYIDFIKRNNENPKIEGFFEMDIDNVVGYEKVLEYRKRLESISDKIIPVWHANRGIDEFINMCKQYTGKRVAITSLGEDIDTGQYNLFINTAHYYNCKIHILGMTSMPVIKTLNLGLNDSVDSPRWIQAGIYGTIDVPSEKYGKICLNGLQGLRTVKNNTFTSVNFLTAIYIQKMLKDKDQSVKINSNNKCDTI